MRGNWERAKYRMKSGVKLTNFATTTYVDLNIMLCFEPMDHANRNN